MNERLFGMETEYALSVILKSGQRGDTEDVAEDIVHLAAQAPHVPGLHSSGIFLANGSRLYVDCGAHPELATPECANPWDICRYMQAGDHMLAGLAEEARKRDGSIAHAMILKGNVDYTARTTWGCHESYLHRSILQSSLARQIIPHLVSRIVFSGAGGFDCFSPGITFMISPRVAHLRNVVSGESTGGSRGIFHTRNEPLSANGYGRLHILCGESLCGHTGAWLKVSTTALAVALIDAGVRPGESVQFQDPLAAMRTFSTDPSCSRAVPLVDGREATAIDVQRHFLEQAEAHMDSEFMPPWTREACRQWRSMLDRLQHGPESVARTLDWAIKLALFRDHARRRNTTLEAADAWSPVLSRLEAELRAADPEPKPLTASLVLSQRGPLAAAKRELTPLLKERGLDWEGLANILALRLELFEIDTRYGILGDRGLFHALDRSGVLEHRFSGVDNIPHAQENPPAIGRAAVRGACIRRVAGQNGRFAAEWDGVWDLQEGNRLDLSDPFCARENWREERREPSPASISRLFREGRYADLLAHFPPDMPGASEDTVLSCARLGRRRSALVALDEAHPNPEDPRRFAMMLWVHTTGLTPDLETAAPLIEDAGRFLEAMPSFDADYLRFICLFCKAVFFMETQRLPEADAILTSLIENPANQIRSRMFSRSLCHLGELRRRQGRTEDALRLVRQAEQIHRSESLSGDLATHSLPMLAKLAATDAEALDALQNAESIHRRLRNDLELARTLCIRARLFRCPGLRPAVEHLFATVEILATCKTARRILEHWDSWTAPAADTGIVDYWGL